MAAIIVSKKFIEGFLGTRQAVRTSSPTKLQPHRQLFGLLPDKNNIAVTETSRTAHGKVRQRPLHFGLVIASA
jgi:hypothetical protein